MIYFNKEIINKFGNTNKIYSNGKVVYQSYIKAIPKPEYTGWAVIGDVNGDSWSMDFPMYHYKNNPNIYYCDDVYFNDVLGMFKLRLNGDWGMQRGQSTSNIHNANEYISVYNGNGTSNVRVYNVVGTPYRIVFDLYNNTIIVEGETLEDIGEIELVWGVIGDLSIGLWSAEVDMVKEGDNYVARDVIFANAEGNGCCFKIRQNHSWDVNFGSYGSAYHIGDEIPLYSYGNNICITDAIVGEPYVITYNPTMQTIIVDGKKYEEPEIPDVPPVEPEPDEPETPDVPVEPEIPDTPIIPEIPDAPEGSKELVITSISKGWIGGGEYEVMFELDDYSTIVIDYYSSNPLATGEYSMDKGHSDFGIDKIYTKWNGNYLDTCKSVVINNGNNNYDFYVEFTLNYTTYHFTYNGDL